MAKMVATFEELLRFASTLPHTSLAVVNPANSETFAAVNECVGAFDLECILVGDEAIIRAGLTSGQRGAGSITIVPALNVGNALATSISLVREGRAQILMKGNVDTSTMMRAVLKEENGLRTGRLMSDVVVLEYAARQENKLVMITDGGLNQAPDLKGKAELIVNAVVVAHSLGNANPKVAVLSATEFVQPNMPSTLDAAALAKMNDRGQIKGCVVDGPLALDNALSPESAAEKGIRSPVAGHAEILVAPNIESANSLAKSATYFADLPLAHVIVGARVPILIPSRADKRYAKLLSVALGMVLGQYRGEKSEDCI